MNSLDVLLHTMRAIEESAEQRFQRQLERDRRWREEQRLEARDNAAYEPRGANSWQDRDAYNAGVRRTGPI